ncbi:amidase [Variovorax terrae]|uniref:Amidase n=1 Tax=Variovorax terrae TaxID=2923278 RepID=A0A9X1VW23_9BURK|nr:amidase [Variovorax terrae]MCJ0764278.1 amidase [Variovorax terrae]
MNGRLPSIAAILQGYRDASLTPLDVARHYIEAYREQEPRYHAWECFDEALFLAQAQAATERLRAGEAPRALEGIPFAVKDIFNTADFPTQMGSALWKGFTPGNDARVLYDIKRLGAIVPGKTVTAEFAVHSLGKTINPHAADRTPGTSSSGSAVAVASGMAPVALGTQTAGSIIRPASFCGIWGCKPSFGLVPRTGILKTTDSLDSVGFFVNHAADLEPVFDALRVHGRNFPISDAALGDAARQAAPEGRPWKVALVRPHVWRHAPAYATEAFDAWCARLAAHPRFELREAALPASMARSHVVHETIYNKALAYYFQEEFKRAELISPVMNRLITAGQLVTPAEYQAALAEQVAMVRDMDDFFADADIVVTLSTAGEAPPREQEEAPDSALMWTLTQLAAVSAPVFSSPAGLPFGLQLVARRYNDPLLFRFIAEAGAHGLMTPTAPV